MQIKKINLEFVLQLCYICITIVLRKYYNGITKVLQKCYKSVTKVLQTKKMKARKSPPKSIRFNVRDFEAGMIKGKFESAQDMVDYLLKNYIQPPKEKNEPTNNPGSTELSTHKTQSMGNLLKSMRDNKI